MSTIVPRWEWRTFGESFGAADGTFASLPPERVQESDELYLLSLEGDASVKVRDKLMDIKHLEHVNDDGLEQWLPVMKAAFPLPAADVASLFRALGVAVPSLARTAYTLDELLDELFGPSNALLAVQVHKRRERYTVGGCRAELTDVSTDRGTTHTVAIESEDPARVIAAVRELGLGSRPNVSFARGLKALIGFGARRYAVIDVGTNSVKFHLGERCADGEWRKLVDRAEMTGSAKASRKPAGSTPGPLSGRSKRSRPWPTRRREAGRWRSQRWAPQVCVSPPTAPRSSTPCRLAAASGSRSSPARKKAGSPTSR